MRREKSAKRKAAGDKVASPADNVDEQDSPPDTPDQPRVSIEDLPKYHELMLPVLQAVERLGGSAGNRQIYEAVIEALAPSEDLLAIHSKREQPIYHERLGWALSYCKLVGVLDSPRRGLYLVTELGHEILATDHDRAVKRLADLTSDMNRERSAKHKTAGDKVAAPADNVDEQDSPPDTPDQPTVSKEDLPNRKELMLPVLQAVERLGGSADNPRIYEAVIEALAPSEELLAIRYQKPGGKSKYLHHLQFALSNCKLVGVLDNPRRGLHLVTELGHEILAMDHDRAVKRLADLYRDMNREKSAKGKTAGDEVASPADNVDEQDSPPDTPEQPTVSKEDLPNKKELMLPVLQAVERLGGSADNPRIYEAVIEALAPSEELLAIRYQKPGGKSKYLHHLQFALSNCKLVGVLDNPRRGLYRVTELGHEVLATDHDRAVKRLADLYRDMNRERSAKGKTAGDEVASPADNVDEQDSPPGTADQPTVSKEDLPNRKELMLPVLQAVERLGGSAGNRQIREAVIEALAPSEELLAIHSKREQPIYHERLDLALQYCKRVGVLDNPRRGLYLVTELGHEILAVDHDRAVKRLADLERDMNRERRERSAKGKAAGDKVAAPADNVDEQDSPPDTPDQPTVSKKYLPTFQPRRTRHG